MSTDQQEIHGSEIVGHTGERDRVYNVKRYDFKRPDKFSLEQIQIFRMIHQTIARGLTATISTRVGRAVEVTVNAVDQMTFVEFMDSVPELSAFAALKLAPLKVPVVMQLDGTLAAFLSDAACGQSTQALSLTEPDRPFAEIEALVLESVLDDFMPQIRDGWLNVVELTPSVGGIENNPRDAQIVPPTEMIVLASLAVSIGGEQAFINIAFPYLTLEPIIHLLSALPWYSSIRRGSAGLPELGDRARDVRVACEVAVPLPDLLLADLPGLLDGEALAVPSLERGAAELRVGTVPIAQVAYDVGLTENHGLELAVQAGPQQSARSPDGDAAAVVSRLDPTLNELRGELRGLRIAVEEMQQDRDVAVAGDSGPDGEPYAPGVYSSRAVRSLDAPAEIAVLVNAERPATIAFLLAPLEAESAARLFAALPPELRDDAARALTTLESADLALHARIMTFLKRRVQTRRESTVAGGPSAVAEILNHVPRSVEKSLMERFMAEDKPLFESIARLMFVFEDFVLVDPLAIRKVAERVSPDELALALKGVTGDVVSHILGALASEDAVAIEEADAALGRVRRSDVEVAQHDVIEELRRLEEAGEVVVARPDEVVE